MGPFLLSAIHGGNPVRHRCAMSKIVPGEFWFFADPVCLACCRRPGSLGKRSAPVIIEFRQVPDAAFGLVRVARVDWCGGGCCLSDLPAM